MTFKEYLKDNEKYTFLTNCQKKFVEAYDKDSNSILCVGSAGSGKTYILNLLFEYLDEIQESYGKTALTGVSSFLLGATTLHSYAGIGLGEGSAEDLLQMVNRNKKARDRIQGVKVLVIDEVSMLKGSLADKVGEVITQIKTFGRNARKYFAEVRMIFVGDFLQLPPVFRGEADQRLFFESEAYKELNPTVINLKELVRQKEGDAMAKMLNKLRFGDKSDLHVLADRVNAKFPNDGIKPINVFSKNCDVDLMNEAELKKIKGEAKYFYAKDEGDSDKIKIFNRDCPAKEMITLKVGANVMLLVNQDTENGFVNGSIGVVESFPDDNTVEVKFKHGTIPVKSSTWEIKEPYTDKSGNTIQRAIAIRQQIPLRLAYASTIHKLQGTTVDRAILDLEGCFASGHVYTALSRVRNLESLSLKSLPRQIKTDEKAVEFMRQFE